MNRTAVYNALALRVRPSGEHREAVFLTGEDGIVRATVFGGPKSRFRSHVAPFNSGRLWIYRDPAKDTRKVSDFDVQSWRPGLRELYERSEAANEMAALVLKSYAAGGEPLSESTEQGGAFAGALDLALSTLDALENADEACCRRLVIRFMWIWAGLLGMRPDPEHCSSCACEAAADGLLWFIRGEGLLCQDCLRRVETRGGRAADYGLPLGPGARRWFLAVENRPAADIVRISLDTESLAEARALTDALLRDV
ncbi:recombinase RecO [Spirochaetia bacterium]|nr:recombinase RecO [Spirochaetia bacterium]